MNLQATTRNEQIVVVDTDGGIWWPGEDAATEINADADPMARAVAMAVAEPMRGEWKQ